MTPAQRHFAHTPLFVSHICLPEAHRKPTRSNKNSAHSFTMIHWAARVLPTNPWEELACIKDAYRRSSYDVSHRSHTSQHTGGSHGLAEGVRKMGGVDHLAFSSC